MIRFHIGASAGATPAAVSDGGIEIERAIAVDVDLESNFP
jgi:hypothetical protein